MNNEFASDLIYIRPIPASRAECIQCHSKNISVSEIIFQGIHVLTKCYCGHCQNNFFQTLPIGHDFLFPISFDETGNKIKADKQAMGWLVQPLIDSIIR